MERQTLQYDAFRQPVSIIEALRYSATLGNQKLQMTVIKILIGFIAFVYLAVLAIALFAAASIYAFIMVVLFLAGLPAILVGIATYAIYKNAVRSLRLKNFSEANGFAFSVNRSWNGYPGIIFGIGHSQQYMTVVNGTYHGQQFEFGNFYCTVGSGKSSRRRSFGVVEVKLGRRMPHILLDSRANNRFGFSNLPVFKGSQRLQLEGDFNKYFDLYVPDGYERDALYVITPELMALLIDLGARYDIELVDDRLYLYSEGEFTLEKQPTIEAIFHLVSVLGGEVQDNTGRYADATVGNRQANIVAEPGRRLKQTMSWISLIFLALWTVYIVFIFFR
jgi:hypothetical protein